MQITQADLLSALAAVAPYSARKSTMPILSCVRLDVDSVAATDLDVDARAPLPGASELACCVDARHLLAVVRALADAPVTLTRDGGMLSVEQGRTKMRLPCLPSADFPALRALPEDSAWTDAGWLPDALAAVLYAVSHDETRHVLNGICLSGGAAVATDGHRLAAAPVDAGALDGAIIPRGLVERLAGASHVARDGQRVWMKAGAVVVGGRLIEGRFPDWRQVVPTEDQTKTRAVVGVAAMLAALQRVGLSSNAKTGATRLTIGGDGIAMHAVDPETGEARDAVDAETSGPDMEIGVRGGYLADALRGLACEWAVIAGGDALSPLLVRPMGDTGRQAVVMPMRI